MPDNPRNRKGRRAVTNRMGSILGLALLSLRLGALGGLSVSSVFGAEDLAFSDPEDAGTPFRQYTLEELMAVDVRAPTKIDQPIREAPTVGTVITREEIEGYGWQTLADVLLGQAGFAPSQDYERITVTSRGQYESWNNNHLRLLVDGVPVNNVSNGTANIWETVPLSMVQSIEIARGPGSALYGSNATNGVIAINTRKPSDDWELQATAGFGNAGTRNLDLSGGKAYPWLRFFTGFRYQETEGNVYDSYDASRRAGSDGRFRKFEVNDANGSYSGYLKADGRGPLTGLSLQTHLAWWEFETAQGWLNRIPDEAERAVNNSGIVSLSYRPPALAGDRLQLEFVGSAQRTHKDYDIKLMPDGSTYLGTPLPEGIREKLISTSADYFTRAQAEYRLVADARLIFGVENMVYQSLGNSIHASNVSLNRGDTVKPYPDNRLTTLRPTNESQGDNPIENVGLYVQGSTGRVLRRLVSATAGVRYDFQYVEYTDLDAADRPVVEKYLDQVSPRLGLVFFPHPNLTLKALAERAFRAPTPSELFSINSLLGFSNPGPLQPEDMTAYTLAADLVLFRHVSLRTDWFWQEFENQIAYSGTRNSTSNIYSRTVTGFESELRVDADLGGDWSLTAFLNHTWAHQLEETILEPSIAPSDFLTWAPETVANLGTLVSGHGFSIFLQGHFQGPVYRRQSDFGPGGVPSAFAGYRPSQLDPWVTVDAGAAYRFRNGLHFRVKGTNILDQEGYLMKQGNYPFDYRIEGARVLAVVEYALPGPWGGFRPTLETPVAR
jgi:outer membrane receptor protein involved in Fe transport